MFGRGAHIIFVHDTLGQLVGIVESCEDSIHRVRLLRRLEGSRRQHEALYDCPEVIWGSEVYDIDIIFILGEACVFEKSLFTEYHLKWLQGKRSVYFIDTTAAVFDDGVDADLKSTFNTVFGRSSLPTSSFAVDLYLICLRIHDGVRHALKLTGDDKHDFEVAIDGISSKEADYLISEIFDHVGRYRGKRSDKIHRTTEFVYLPEHCVAASRPFEYTSNTFTFTDEGASAKLRYLFGRYWDFHQHKSVTIEHKSTDTVTLTGRECVIITTPIEFTYIRTLRKLKISGGCKRVTFDAAFMSRNAEDPTDLAAARLRDLREHCALSPGDYVHHKTRGILRVICASLHIRSEEDADASKMRFKSGGGGVGGGVGGGMQLRAKEEKEDRYLWLAKAEATDASVMTYGQLPELSLMAMPGIVEQAKCRNAKKLHPLFGLTSTYTTRQLIRNTLSDPSLSKTTQFIVNTLVQKRSWGTLEELRGHLRNYIGTYSVFTGETLCTFAKELDLDCEKTSDFLTQTNVKRINAEAVVVEDGGVGTLSVDDFIAKVVECVHKLDPTIVESVSRKRKN